MNYSGVNMDLDISLHEFFEEKLTDIKIIDAKKLKESYIVFNKNHLKDILFCYKNKKNRYSENQYFLLAYQNYYLCLAIDNGYYLNDCYALKATTVKNLYEALKNNQENVDNVLTKKDAFNQKDTLIYFEKYFLDNLDLSITPIALTNKKLKI